MDRLVTPGSKWYVLAMDWVQQWQKYTYFDYLEDNDSDSAQISDKERQISPGPLNNSSILAEIDKQTVILEQMKAKIWMNTHLKPNLKEGLDYMLVSEEIFDFLLKKYGCT